MTNSAVFPTLPDSPYEIYVKGTSTDWYKVDLIDAGATRVKTGASTWVDVTEVWVKTGASTWVQVADNVNPANPTLSSRSFTSTSFTMSWTNPLGVWKYEIKRRDQAAADTEGNYTTIVGQTTSIATSMTDAVGAGSVGNSMANPVNGSTTNVQGPRYVYRVRIWDNFGHMGELQVDTLRGRVASPLYVRPQMSGTWRGSAFRTSISDRAYQGYTATGMNYGHYWYGGSGGGIVNNCFSNVLLPTCTGADIMMAADSGGVANGNGGVKPWTWLHGQLSKATTNAWSNNGTGNQEGTGQDKETQTWTTITTANGTNLIGASGSYRGVCLYDSSTTLEAYGTSRQYRIYYAYNEPQASQYPGTLRIYHGG